MLYDLGELNSHIVDLNRSDWDKERSDRSQGVYFFKPTPGAKVYIKKSDYDDSASRPAHILKFIDVEKLAYNRAKFGAEPVTTSDPYWPEPMVPNADGKYIYMDAILVKIADMEGYIDFRQAERNRATGFKEARERFNDTAGAAGAGLRPGDIEDMNRGASKR
jgi:hypothetical protein